jgi:hypothetical protein
MIPFLKPQKDDGHSRRIAIDLGEITPLYYAQYQQWHELFLAGPTQSVVGTSSNDFPGLFYYDPRDRLQHVLMFEGDVDWRHCQLNRHIIEQPDGSYHLMVGLFSDQKIDGSIKMHHSKIKRTLSAGQQAGDRDAMPDQWEALETLTQESFQLLPLPEAGKPHDWRHEAELCVETLMKKSAARKIGERELLFFYEIFASNDSTYAPKRPESEYKGTGELICQAGLASALLNYSRASPRNAQDFRNLGIQLKNTLTYFYDETLVFFQNTYPPKGEEWTRAVFDTWYAFHNLFHVLRVAGFTNDVNLRGQAHSAVKRMISFVRSCNYQIPLFAKLCKADEQGGPNDGALIGIASNTSVLGMYAMLLVEAANTFEIEAAEYREEAKVALRNLRRRPITQMFHQTLQLSWAAWAAHRLGETKWRDDFTRCLLLSCYRQGPNAGLFQGCAGLLYPTFRESVEAVIPFIEFQEQIPELPLRLILNLVLNKARLFLCEAPHAGLPQEGLATCEQPQAKKIGIAIYAAPQVFELAQLALFQKNVQ